MGNLSDYLEKAKYYCDYRQWDKAIASYQRALELNPNLPGIHQKIGDALQQQAKAEQTNLLNTNFKKDCYNKIGTKLLSDWSY